MDDILARGKLPIVAGGTGLYVDSLLSGRTFASFTPESGHRARLQAIAAAEGLSPLRAELERRGASLEKRLAKAAELDAAAAEKIARDEKGFAGISKILDALYARLSERLAAAKSGVLPLPEADFAAKTPNEKFREFASLYARAAAADRAYSDDAGGVKTGVFLRASGAERRNGVARLKVRAPGKGGK